MGVETKARALLERAQGADPFGAFDPLYGALLTVSRAWSDSGEKQRLEAMIDGLPPDQLRTVLHSDAVETLLSLDPPLDTMLDYPDERLDRERVVAGLAAVRDNRRDDLHGAAKRLGGVVYVIRNKRYHHLKDPGNSRHQRILRAACRIIEDLVETALRSLPPRSRPGG